MTIDDAKRPIGQRLIGHELPADGPFARIADLLGCSVEAFTDGAKEPLDVRAASELLTLWAEMDGDGDRAALLGYARRLASMRPAD